LRQATVAHRGPTISVEAKGVVHAPLVMYVFTQPVIACRNCGFVFGLLRAMKRIYPRW
jgi:hypothetical protein